MKAQPGREVARKLVEAMGLPVEGCTSVEVDLPYDDVAKVHVSYVLTDDAIRALAAAMEDTQ